MHTWPSSFFHLLPFLPLLKSSNAGIVMLIHSKTWRRTMGCSPRVSNNIMSTWIQLKSLKSLKTRQNMSCPLEVITKLDANERNKKLIWLIIFLVTNIQLGQRLWILDYDLIMFREYIFSFNSRTFFLLKQTKTFNSTSPKSIYDCAYDTNS